MVSPREKVRAILSGYRGSALNFITAHPIAIEIFQSGPKWRTDRCTVNIPCNEYFKLASIPVKGHSLMLQSGQIMCGSKLQWYNMCLISQVHAILDLDLPP